jgi:hypothetical protein
MPEMSAPQYGFRHTINSALETLEDLGVSPRRITIRMAGLGWPSGWVVGQKPEGGATLAPDTFVRLSVAGLGLFHRLPVGMWDRAGDGRIGTQEIVELFDDPFQKAAHWIWEGARVFDLRPDRPLACERWISLFGLNPSDWPEENWYELSLLLPALQQIAATESGMRAALRQLMGVEIVQITPWRRYLPISPKYCCTLTSHNYQLGIDSVIGRRVEDLRGLDIRLGPMEIDRYDDLRTPANARRLAAAIELSIPLYQNWRLSYEVLDRNKAPLLGVANGNSRLGVNSYLGRTN